MLELCTPCDQDAGVDKLTQFFDEVITSLLDKMAPATKVIIQERQRQPYLTKIAIAPKAGSTAWENLQSRQEMNMEVQLVRGSSFLVQCSRKRHLFEKMQFSSRVAYSRKSAGWSQVKLEPTFLPEDYHDFIDKKIEDVRSATASADQLTVVDCRSSDQWQWMMS